MDSPSLRRRKTIGRSRSGWLAGSAAPVFLLTFAMQLAAQERRPDPRLDRLRELQPAERQALVGLTARPVRVQAGDEVMFNARLSGEVLPEVLERAAFELHFGDGQVVRLEEPTAAHVYERPGEFRAYVAIRVEMRGEVVEQVVSEPVMISVVPRQADVGPPPAGQPGLWLRADPPEVPAGQPVRFFAELDPPPQRPVDYRFDFGDGVVRDWSPDPTAVHVYARPGEFGAVVAVGVNEDPFARSVVTVAVIAAYSLGLEASDDTPEAGEPVRLFGGLEPPADGATYEFDFGDGGRSGRLREPVADHAYERPGSYEVVLRASVGERVVASTGLALRVQGVQRPGGELPSITLVVRPREARSGGVVRFEAFGPPSGAPVEYRFHFGDGDDTGWRSVSVAEHRYPDDGDYDAFVEVRNAAGLVRESNVVPVTVVPAPTPTPAPPAFPWELLIGGAGLALLLGSAVAIGLRRGRRMQPREPAPAGSHLKVEAHPDDGTRGLDRGHDALIRAELRLRPVFDPGQQSIESDGPVVKREWALTTPLESQ